MSVIIIVILYGSLVVVTGVRVQNRDVFKTMRQMRLSLIEIGVVCGIDLLPVVSFFIINLKKLMYS